MVVSAVSSVVGSVVGSVVEGPKETRACNVSTSPSLPACVPHLFLFLHTPCEAHIDFSHHMRAADSITSLLRSRKVGS